MKPTKKKTITTLALLVGLAGAPAALSHLDSDAFNVSYRQSLFAIVGANFGPMSAMIKGEMPWDDAQFKSFADDLAATSKLNFERGFPSANRTDAAAHPRESPRPGCGNARDRRGRRKRCARPGPTLTAPGSLRSRKIRPRATHPAMLPRVY